MQYNKVITLIIIYFLMHPCSISSHKRQSQKKKDIKILMLIIASDDQPVYVELQKIWRSYMHSDPEHIEAYFIKADPHLDTLCKIDGDTIWSRSVENIKTGIIHKTIYSLQLLLPRIRKEFDYVVRTNLSSFYIFPRLINFLKKAPRRGFYAGSSIAKRSKIGSGSGYIISSDVVQFIAFNQQQILRAMPEYDDVIMGRFLTSYGYQLVNHPRLDCHLIKDWHTIKKRIAKNVFQLRVKGPDNIRVNNDIFIHQALRSMFYKVL